MPTDPANPDEILRDPDWSAPVPRQPANYLRVDGELTTIDRRLHTAGKGRYDLVSHAAVRAMALRLEHGLEKYPGRDWQRLKTPAQQAVLWDKAFRHLHQAAAGQADEDHLAAALTNIAFLIDLRDAPNPVDATSGPRVGG